MKTKEKIKGYFLWLIRLFLPKSELEKQLDGINKLKNNPENYGKVAAMYLKLHNINALLIGKGVDDKWNFFLADVYGKQYKMYRELYFEYKLEIKN